MSRWSTLDGAVVAKRRISDDSGRVHAAAGAVRRRSATAPRTPIPVAIETTRGLLVACLRATGRQVFAINPMAVARYRERHSVARKKSDAGDALVLGEHPAHRHGRAPAAAGRLRTRSGGGGPGPRPAGRGLGPHLRAQQAPLAAARVLPGDPGRVRRPSVTASCVQRPALILAAAPDPTRGGEADQDPAAGSCSDGPAANAASTPRPPALQTVLRAALPAPTRRWSKTPSAARLWRYCVPLDAACTNADELAAAAVTAFDQHPDAKIITSLPGLGSLTGARVLAEIGDDRSRFADARALKAYAGAAPVTRATGKSLTVHAPQGQEPTPRRSRLRLGLLRPDRLARRPRPLRPPPAPPATVTPPPNATCSTA